MDQLTKGQKLQKAFREQIAPYSLWVQAAVTLTLKTSAKIRIKRFENYGTETYEFLSHLDEDKIKSRITYFTALLTDEIYGNKAKHKNKKNWAKPLVISAIEGRNTYKHVDLHFAIGNIPEDKLCCLEAIVRSVWSRCDFANKQICVKPVTCAYGWLSYITKEMGYTDNDVLDVNNSTIPQFIKQRICTESRLQAE